LKLFFVLLGLMCALPCGAGEPLAGLLACRSLTDAAARLACFDREAAALASAPAVLVAPAPLPAPAPGAAPTAPATAATPGTTPAAAPSRPAAVLDAQQSFGLNGSAIAANEEASGARPPKVSKIEARIVGLALTANGRTLFTLDNAQVWQQLESNGDVLARLGDAAAISRGLLGSYWLQMKNGRGCKVTRVR
jgi:hypothetical protein